VEFEVAPLAEITKRFETRAIGRGIQFGGDNNHRFFDERCAKGFQFAVDDLKRTDRIVGVGVARVDEMDEQSRAFDVAEKTDTQARPQVCAINKTGEVGDDEGAAKFGAVSAGASVGVDDAEIRLERGEWIVRNLGTRSGNHRNQSGLARIGVTDQADVGQKFQLQAKMPLFAGKSVLMFARSLMPRLGKVLIAAPAASAVCDQDALARVGEISDGRALFVKHQRAYRNLQDHVLAGVASAVGAFAVAAPLGLEFAIVAVAQQRVVVWIGFQIDVAAVAAIAAGGTSAWNVFLAPEGHATVAAATGLHENFGFINEHRNKTP